ncbi:MAG: Uncharacterized MFS-type transporter [uncultured Caballeronia sp.]|nr:MAG: Uncharacterized MFS-type transporter [uncultured Caballeronia sp.]
MFDKTLAAGTLKSTGYPAKADPALINWPMAIIMMIFVKMVYGPIAAMLVEMFLARIRYNVDVAALSHWQWLVRRVLAGDGVCYRGREGEYFLGAVVSDCDRLGNVRD